MGDIGDHLINNLCATDDLFLICLSSAGMQSLLDIRYSYATEHVLPYHRRKSYSLCFKPKHVILRNLFSFKSIRDPKVDQ